MRLTDLSDNFIIIITQLIISITELSDLATKLVVSKDTVKSASDWQNHCKEPGLKPFTACTVEAAREAVKFSKNLVAGKPCKYITIVQQ